MNLQQVVLSLGVFVTLLRDRCYGDEDTEHVHIKLHVPEIINRHVHVKTKYMHVYHPKKIVQELPAAFPEQHQPLHHHQQQQLMDPAGMSAWLPSAAPHAPLAASSPSAMAAAAAAASFTSMVQDKLSSQLAQELMQRYRNQETPALGESAGESDYLHDYYRQQRKLSDQLMLQEAMQLPNFAQTKYLSSMGWDWDKSFGVKPSDADQPLPVKKSKKKKKDFKTYAGL